MKWMYVPVAVVMTFWTICRATGGDWPQWRGPERNGVAAGTLTAFESLDGCELRRVWKTEAVLSDKDGGFGSPVVADGRVFLYCSWRTYHPLTHRTLNKQGAERVGVVPDGLPDGWLDKIEAARLSEQRAAVDRRQARDWSRAWVAENMAGEDLKPFRSFAESRLQRGQPALTLDVLAKVAGIVDRRFETEDALDEWFREQSIDAASRKEIEKHIPTRYSTIEDTIWAFDASSGSTLWKRAYPSAAGGWGASSTPCVAGGRVYVAGGKGNVYCLRADSGEEIWRTTVAGGEINSSFACHEGRLFIQAGRLVALDAETGTLVWEQKEAKGNDTSPVFWDADGKRYVLGGSNPLCCVDPADGRMVWKTEAVGHSTPAIADNLMAVQHAKGIRVYRLTAQGAELLHSLDKGGSRGGSALCVNGRVFATAGKEALCLDVAEGSTAWEVKGLREDFSSPIWLSGRLLCLGDKNQLYVLDAASGATLGKWRTDFLRCTSPAVSGDRIVVRTRNGVDCLELVRPKLADAGE